MFPILIITLTIFQLIIHIASPLEGSKYLTF